MSACTIDGPSWVLIAIVVGFVVVRIVRVITNNWGNVS